MSSSSRIRAAKKAAAKEPTQAEIFASVLQHVNAKFPDQIRRMDENASIPGWISTQSPALDWLVGGRGLPLGRIVDASGAEGVGKSTFLDHVIAEMQARDGYAYVWDTENSREEQYQDRIGIVRAKAGEILSDTLEEGFDAIYEILCKHRELTPHAEGIVGWDTPAGIPSLAEVEDKPERFGPAKIIRRYLRKINQVLADTRFIWVIVNQTYQKPLPTGFVMEETYGGKGIPFYSSISLRFSKRSVEYRPGGKEKGLPPLGHFVDIKTTKNRVGAPGRTRRLFLKYGYGFSPIYDVVEQLVGYGAIAVNRGWFKFDHPDLAAVFDKSWQGGWMAVEDLVYTPGNEALWPALQKVYLEAVKAEETNA